MINLDKPGLFSEPEVTVLRRVFERIIYFSEMFLAPLLAVLLFETSMPAIGESIVLAAAGIVSWTLAEYAFHRFMLHHLIPDRHRMHHAHPEKPVVGIIWQIWACFAVVYWIAGAAVLAGSLVAYAWYLYVHHCSHHSVDRLPPFLIKSHKIHHRFANRNYGVTTTFWDHVFGTALR